MSTVKLLIVDKVCNKGVTYCSIAVSMSQLDGRELGVNNEKVRWYEGAYFSDRVVRRARSEASSAEIVRPDLGRDSRPLAVVDCWIVWPADPVEDERELPDAELLERT